MPRFSRPIALALAGLVLTAALAGCSGTPTPAQPAAPPPTGVVTEQQHQWFATRAAQTSRRLEKAEAEEMRERLNTLERDAAGRRIDQAAKDHEACIKRNGSIYNPSC